MRALHEVGEIGILSGATLAPVVDVTTLRARAGARPVVPLVCSLAGIATVLGGWALLERRFDLAGWAALASGVLLIVAGSIVRETDRPREWLVLSLADRAFDGIVFGGLVWVLRGSDPGAAVGALVALAAGFLAAYVQARGGSLGYGIEASVIVPALRSLLIAVGLLAGWTGAAVWIVAALLLLTSIVRASQVAKEERA
jgi:hypothetical protein